MRARYIDRKTGRRARVITNDVDSLCRMDCELSELGYEQVGIVRFLIAVVFPKKRKRPDNDAE